MFVAIWRHCELIQVIDADFQFITHRALQRRHNERDGVSNRQPHDCLVKRLFRRRSKEISKLRVTGLCEGNSPVAGEFPAQKASNAENVPFDDAIMASVGHVVPPTRSRGREQMTAPIRRYTHSPLALTPVWINNGGLSQLNILTPTNKAEYILQATFWTHFLDIVWTFKFSLKFVYKDQLTISVQSIHMLAFMW